MRKCVSCQADKELSEFYRNNTKPGFFRKCKRCCLDYNNKIKRTPEGKSRSRWYSIKYLYGMTQESFNILLSSQNNLCAICNDPLGDKPVIDHCHSTRKVRGIVHQNCNALLGLAKDNEDILFRAISYLRKNTIEDSPALSLGECKEVVHAV